MTALTGDELLNWKDDTTRRWLQLVENAPQILTMPCDVRETENAGQLLQHIVAVALRYAERLTDQPATDYEAIPYDSAAALRAAHQRAMDLLRPLLDEPGAFWDAEITFATRSAGELTATRRTVLVHLCMHSVRHFAQLAKLVRQHGVQPGWPMDYLFQQMKPAMAK